MGESFKVKLAIYDLSNGMAKSMSTAFLGKQIEAIYHTGRNNKNQTFGLGVEPVLNRTELLRHWINAILF